MNLAELIPPIGFAPVYLKIKVLPKSPKNEVTDQLIDGTIKIRIKATPEKGKANKELISFMSKELGINGAKISIISGASDPVKLVKISP